MKKNVALFIVFTFLAITQASAEVIDLSLDPAHWIDYSSNTSYSKTTTADGLRFTCHGYRRTMQVRTAYTFNLQNATLQYKWRISGLGAYCWTGDAPGSIYKMGPNLTTHHSWAGSIVVPDNAWIYTEVNVNPDKTWNYDYSYTGYGNGGISHGGGVLSAALWDSMADTFLHKLLGDNYRTYAYFEINEITLIPHEPVVHDADIIAPATDSYFGPTDSITFTGEEHGDVDPATFVWTSSLDGLLGTGQSVATTLSVGTHTISLEYNDTEGGTGYRSITVYIITPPLIDDIPDAVISTTVAYTGPAPSVSNDSKPVTWSLIAGPAGMTINASTGIVSWLAPQMAGSPHTVTIQADNAVGSDQETWQLDVMVPPVISSIANEDITEYLPYAGPTPVLDSGTLPVTWSLVQGPAGMTIDTAGVVSWASAQPSFTAYPITIRATNPAGSDDETWNLTVLSPPAIAAIANDWVNQGQSYTGAIPTLTKGTPVVSWSLDLGPAGMTINTSTGVVSWTVAVADGSPHPVTIRATNDYGTTTQSFDLSVIIPPIIHEVGDSSVVETTTHTQQLTLAEGTEPVVWSLVTSPAGMTINPAGWVSWPSVPAVVGPHDVTAQASNSAGADQVSWQLTVLTIPQIDPVDDVSVIEGTPYTSVVPTLSKGTPPVTWSLVSAAPAGMTIDPTSGVVSWLNTRADASPYTITIRATNAQGFDDESWLLNVIRPPVVSEIDDDWVAEGSTYTGPVPTLDDGTLPVSWSLTAAPAGMTINTDTGVVSWPNALDVGVHAVTVKAQNLAGFDEESWQVEVLALPVIDTIADHSVVENTTYTGAVPTLLKGSLPISYSLVTGPAGMTIDVDTGVVSWSEAVPSFTPYTVTIQASNIAGNDEESWQLSVLSVPAIDLMADASVLLGSPYSAQPTLTKGVPAVTWTLDVKPAGMTINPTTGEVSWPAAMAEGSINTVTVRATNSQGFGIQSWQVTVMLPPQIDPVSDDTVHEGSTYTMTPSLNQGTSPVTWSLASAPLGVLVDPATGVVSWPHASGQNTPHQITLNAANDVGSDQKTWTLNVLRPPIIRHISNDSVAQGNSYTGPIPSLYQGDEPITYSLVSAPAGMTINSATGVVSWGAAIARVTPYTITIAADNIVGSDTQSWLLTVIIPPVINPIPDAITASNTPYTGAPPSVSQGQDIIWSLESSPAGMTINSLTGVVSWPDPIASATAYDISVRATNIAGSDLAQWRLTVMDSPVIADIADDTAGEMVPYTGPTPALLQGDGTVNFSLIQAPAQVTIDPNTGVVHWPLPTVAGSPHSITIRAENIVGSDDESWLVTVPIGYTATVATDIDVEPMGTTIPLYGQANWISSGTPAANVPVQIIIELRGMVRTIDTVTDAAGNFSEQFVPLPQEAGIYSIMADHPFGSNYVVEDQFTLFGMRSEPSSAKLRLLVQKPETGSFQLVNLGDTPLTGVNAVITDGPPNIDLQINTPAQLDPQTSAEVRYSITAFDSSVTSATVQIELISAEGATAAFTMDIGITPLTPLLKVYPESLTSGMIRGGRKTVQFEVFNAGAAPTPELTVLIPEAPWLQMTNPEVIGVLEPNDVTVVTLALTPAADLALGPYSGSIIVYGTGMSRTIPFEFNCASDFVGDLEITAVDEFTYFAAGAPNVDNATVTLTDIIADTVIASKMPMTAGVLLLEDLPETYYKLEVNAPDHAGFDATVYVAPGVTSTVTAFLSRQVVKYVWTVVPTEIIDVYTVTLTTQYETNVPAPVVTVEPAKVDFADMVDGTMQVDFTISNHGLVAAEDFHLEFDKSDRYEVVMLTDYNGTVGPGVTLTIPVLITDLNYTPPGVPIQQAEMATGQESCERLLGGGFYRVVCGDDGKWKHIPIAMANWSCSVVETIVTIMASEDPPDYNPDYDYKSDSKPYVQPTESGSGKTTVSTTTSSSRGGVVVIEGNGGNHADRGVGTNRQRPYVTHTTITTSNNETGGCDPCPRKRAEAVIDCAVSFLPLGCPMSIAMGLDSVIGSCLGEGATNYKCISSIINATGGSLVDCVKDLSPYGVAWKIAMCAHGVISACDDVTVASASAPVQLEGAGHLLSQEQQDLQFLTEQHQRLVVYMEAITELVGDPIWFSGLEGEEQILGDWLETYFGAMEESSGAEEYISTAERTVLLGMPLPSQITMADVDAACDRWNRTLDYWLSGIFKTEHLNPGDDTNFIDLDVFSQKWHAAAIVEETLIAEGYENIFGGIHEGLERVKGPDPDSQAGVCAKVKLEIVQSAVMTRSAFRATLSMENTGPDNLENMAVVLEITGQSGNAANDLFGVYPPTLTGISNLNGSGVLASLASMQAEWIIVPTSDAAPTEAIKYLVGGQISYTIDGLDVSIPITPDVITVKPDPKLHVRYFQEHHVYADDPFTPEIEPSIPFSLGLMMTNAGAGTAYNVSISSAQPQIVRHEQDKDILLDFGLVGTQIAAQSVTPSLTVNLGHIEPGQSRVAQWLMQASLEGEFTAYNASFEHVDTLGDPRLSLIESVEVHELIHTVRADYPEDDLIPDFLVNDIADEDSLPDTLYLSDGTIVPVDVVLDAVIDSPATAMDLEVELTATMSGAYNYIRIPDPGDGLLYLVRVTRSDGKIIPVTQNAWTTSRIVRELGEEPYQENLLHLFDYNGPGSYTLLYTTDPDAGSLQVTIQPNDAVLDGARWRVDSGEWMESGELAGQLSAGIHIVEFNELPGWIAPPGGQIPVASQQTSQITAWYLPQSTPTGLLEVTITPQEVIDSGALWQLDDTGPWYPSSHVLDDIATGQHTISFSEIPDWVTPSPQTVTILPDQTEAATGNYTPVMYTLTFIIGADGTPTVTEHKAGTVVPLSVVPDDGFRVMIWSGADVVPAVGSNSNTATMFANRMVTVEFEPIPVDVYQLTVTVVGQGTVQPGSGIYEDGTIVTLTADPAPGWQVKQWTGTNNDPSPGVEINTVTMNGPQTVTVEFEPIPVSTYELVVTVFGQGTVAPDSGTYDAGTPLTLVATPTSGWHFIQWSGDAVGTSTSIAITMDDNKNISAHFGQDPGVQAPSAQIIQITPNPAQKPADIILFEGAAEDLDGTIDQYEWSSSLDEVIGNSLNFQKAAAQLSAGNHEIAFRVMDNDGLWSIPVTAFLIVQDVTNPSMMIYVDQSNTSGIEEGSILHPYSTIQRGVDVALSGASVIVAPGTYHENVEFRNENIVLTSSNPEDPDIVATTTIDGISTGSCVTFTGNEDPGCLLKGFTITNGAGSVENNYHGAGVCGGDEINSTHATISHCVIMNNGLNCQFGGGLAFCDGIITNCIVYQNTALQDGGGLYHCNGQITNCSIIENSAGRYGGGICDCIGSTTNCVLYDNLATIDGPEYYVSSIPTYSCLHHTATGTGSFVADPLLADPGNGNFHILPLSPCIDTGNPTSCFGLEPEPDGGRINIGAYGNTPEATCEGGLILKSYNSDSMTRLGRTTFDYRYTVTLYNSSSLDALNVVAQLLDAPANVAIIDPDVSITSIAAGHAATSTDAFTVRIDSSVPIDPTIISWRVTFDWEGAAGLSTQNVSSRFVLTPTLGDITGDNIVNIEDFAKLARFWLQDEPSVDIAPSPNGDGIVDLQDLAILVGHWLE